MNNKRILLLILLGVALWSCIIDFAFYDRTSIIPDRQLQAIVREKINKPHGVILPEDCAGIKELKIGFNYSIRSLKGLRFFIDLEVLECYQTGIRNISELSKLDKLKKLDLRDTRVRDLTPLAGLKELEEINLYWVKVKDLRPLTQCPKLNIIYIDDYYDRDYSVLDEKIIIMYESNELGG